MIMVPFWVVTPSGLVVDTDVMEKDTLFIFSLEGRDIMFIQNIGIYM
jgi:hypothetical protein